MKFLTACLASTAIVVGSPFMGQLQSFLRRSLSTRNYVLLFGVGMLAAVGLAILIAVRGIRDRRASAVCADSSAARAIERLSHSFIALTARASASRAAHGRVTPM